jgi:hypothetical protein
LKNLSKSKLSQGFAPALYAVRDLGSYTMVVMEKLDLRAITSKETKDVTFKGRIFCKN